MSEAFANLVYQICLRRPPLQQEIADILQWLKEGYQQGEILEWIYNSDEAVAMQSRLFVPPGHVHSPIVDVARLKKDYRRRVRPVAEDIRDVDLDRVAMSKFWDDHLAPVLRTPAPDSDRAPRYSSTNPAYPVGDAAILKAMIAHHKPQRIIEVGCGHSTAALLDALDQFELAAKLTCIDPKADVFTGILRSGDAGRFEHITDTVHEVPFSNFETLEADDLLLIDSSHVLKTESDLHLELTEILPRLKTGVVVQFRHIFYPFNYFRQWVFEQNRSWNEAYALRAFLAYNASFKVIFFNHMFALLEQEKLAGTFPSFVETPGSGIWIKRLS